MTVTLPINYAVVRQVKSSPGEEETPTMTNQLNSREVWGRRYQRAVCRTRHGDGSQRVPHRRYYLRGTRPQNLHWHQPRRVEDPPRPGESARLDHDSDCQADTVCALGQRSPSGDDYFSGLAKVYEGRPPPVVSKRSSTTSITTIA